MNQCWTKGLVYLEPVIIPIRAAELSRDVSSRRMNQLLWLPYSLHSIEEDIPSNNHIVHDPLQVESELIRVSTAPVPQLSGLF